MTKTLEDELAEITKRYAEEAAALRIKHSIQGLLAAIPELEGYAPPHVHPTSLWGINVLITFEQQRWPAIAKGKSPDADFLAFLLGHFPAEGAVKVSDGCTSFRPATGWDGKGTATPVSPYRIDITLEHNPGCKVTWVSKLSDGTLAVIQVEMPLKSRLGNADLVRAHDQDGGPTRLIRCGFRKHSSDATAQHWAPEVIRWASGGSNYANTFTCWWSLDKPPLSLPDYWR